MRYRAKAFSLIELMIVIAIVAILSAIAVPAYKNYALSARFQSVIPAVDGILNKMISFANAQGYWPTNTEIGLTNPASAAAQISPYLSSFTLGDAPCLNGGGTSGNLIIFFDATALGSEVDLAAIGCYIWKTNGIFNKKCGYALSGNGRSFPGDMMPPGTGWVNYYSNSTYGHVLYDQELLVTRTCDPL